MLYPWNEIKRVIERIEYDRVVDELSSLEYRDGFVQRRPTLTDKTKGYLDFLGKLSVGICVGIFAVMFNFLLFVWLIHIEVNPETASTFEKKPKNSSAVSYSAISQQNSSETSGYSDKENSKESNHVFEHAARYGEQIVKWVSDGLEVGTVNVMQGVYSAMDKLIESAGLHAEKVAKVGKDAKETDAVAYEERFIGEKQEVKEDVVGLQQQNDPSGTVYTVQVGAFKDYHRADLLKTRLIKKGYDAHMSFTGSQSDISIFKLCKVWIGKFTHREKAERVSAEIGEAEGLQAFVTLKNE
jgi:hypothetical protein